MSAGVSMQGLYGQRKTAACAEKESNDQHRQTTMMGCGCCRVQRNTECRTPVCGFWLGAGCGRVWHDPSRLLSAECWLLPPARWLRRPRLQCVALRGTSGHPSQRAGLAPKPSVPATPLTWHRSRGNHTISSKVQRSEPSMGSVDTTTTTHHIRSSRPQQSARHLVVATNNSCGTYATAGLYAVAQPQRTEHEVSSSFCVFRRGKAVDSVALYQTTQALWKAACT